MKRHLNPSTKDLLHYGEIIKWNDFETKRGYYTIRIFKYKGNIYFHKMKDGQVVEVINLTNNPAP